MKVALAFALALASASAMALGLGQIEVKSRIGQPLVAEIPIISSDPSELEELRAGLALPETFARIGLQPPRGIVADLQFTPALDAAGRPVIRVTSAQPVSEPLLTFLVEVDWGQGRLVREYSALVDAPRTVSAPAQPPIEAPVISEPNVIERPVPTTAAKPVVATPPPSPPARPVPVPAPTRPDSAIATAPPRPIPAAPARPAPTAAAPGQYGPVKAGESLSRIAGQIDVANGFTLEQSMIALLRANPAAFIDGNINQLKQGVVLRIPPATETADLEARQAMAMVRDQVRQWRQAHRATPQPSASTDSAPVSTRSTVPASAPVARREAGARLEIVPPGASRATRAGTQSGLSAGGEGEMLRQELQQTKESLAARDAELRELKSRVADLEKLQADQQQLLSLKDSELAAAQQRLAESNKAQSVAPVQGQAQPAVATQATSPVETRESTLPWVLGGVGLLALVLVLGGWLLRRRAKPASGFRAPPSTKASSLADTFGPAPPRKAGPVAPSDSVSSFDAVPAAEAVQPTIADAAAPAPRSKPSSPARPEVGVSDPVDMASEFDNRRERQQLPSRRAEAPAPAWHNGASKSKAPAVAPDTVSTAESSLGERLELAQAYLDLGDRDSARQLLGEVAVNGDHAARQQASRMLRELE